VYLFAVNTNSANSILSTTFNGTSWTAWAAVAGTDSGTQLRRSVSGYPKVQANQVGLLWTQGDSPYDAVVTSFGTASVDTLAPAAPSNLRVNHP
jgi:hypothetical protein